MKIAYLIMAHDNPLHLNRLVNSLSSDSCEFFIHIDKKSDFKKFSDLKQSNIHFSEKRINVYIAHYTQVEATLLLMKQALASSVMFDRFVLLSGVDYPLRSNSFINSFFTQHPNTEFIDCVELPNPAWGQRITRYTRFKMHPTIPSVVRSLRRSLIKLRLIPAERNISKYLGNMTPCVGATWWALSREAVQYIFRFIKNNKRIVNFYKNMFNPDEAFFQTILVNSDFKKRIGPTLTYVDWRECNPHPAIIREEHISMMGEENMIHFNSTAINHSDTFLFARKFTDNSTDIVNSIDRLIAESDSTKALRIEESSTTLIRNV